MVNSEPSDSGSDAGSFDDIADRRRERETAKIEAVQRAEASRLAIDETKRLGRAIEGTPSDPLADPLGYRLLASDAEIARRLLAFASAFVAIGGLPYLDYRSFRLRGHAFGGDGLGHEAGRRLWQLAIKLPAQEDMARAVGEARTALGPYDPSQTIGDRADTQSGLIDILIYLAGVTERILRAVQADAAAKAWGHRSLLDSDREELQARAQADAAPSAAEAAPFAAQTETPDGGSVDMHAASRSAATASSEIGTPLPGIESHDQAPRLEPAARRARDLYAFAMGVNPALDKDRAVFEWLSRRSDLPVPLPKTYETWRRQLSEARRLCGENKHTPRLGRATGGPIVRKEDV